MDGRDDRSIAMDSLEPYRQIVYHRKDGCPDAKSEEGSESNGSLFRDS